MTLENICCSLEISKKLKDLGVPQDSLFYWPDKDFILMGCKEKWKITDTKGLYQTAKYISAFTSSELGEMLPNHFHTIRCTNLNIDHYECLYPHDKMNVNKFFRADTEADARAKMLIYLLENPLTPQCERG